MTKYQGRNPMEINMITQQQVLALFEYRDGALYWKVNATNTKIGQRAGTVSKGNKYRRIGIDKKYYLEHRLVWLMFNKELPELLDHVDNNPLNNRIENLRTANRSQNGQNKKTQTNNTSGIKNVHWSKEDKKWTVKMMVNKKLLRFGQYFDIDYAKFVAEAMRYKYHGKFARS